MMSGKVVPLALRALLTGSVAASALAFGSAAVAETCRTDGEDFAGDCRHYNAGTVVRMPVQSNVSELSAPDLGDVGFSISLDAPVVAGPSQGRRTLAGAPARAETLRAIDRVLDQADVDLTFDGLGVRPRLAIATADLREGFVAGEAITFRASSNYPAWIKAAQVVITDARGDEVARLPIAPNGTTRWVMPQPPAGPAQETAGLYAYRLEAADAAGRRDVTHTLALRRVQTPEILELDGPVTAAGEGQDMLAERGIPVSGGAITVSGRTLRNAVRVMGEDIPADPSGRFITQRILPPGVHAVPVSVDGQLIERAVTIRASEWFATGIADVTLGRDSDGLWKLGRLAGFADGRLANGLRLRAAVDTDERELRDLFRHFGRKNPDQSLRQIRPGDVFATFGDDSASTELAPTSGRLFLRADKGRSHAQWGDFKPQEDLQLTVRSDRALYGLSGKWASEAVTASGDSRAMITGFAAAADSLMNRDVLRATGGSAYLLSRQDILAGSETLYVQTISRTTGVVVSSRRLAEGTDYRINPVQGMVLLNAPLSPQAGGSGLVQDSPLGDYDVSLVAQYEYVPTTGQVDGYTSGARAEAWLNNALRLGAAAVRETTGLADNTLLGADLLLRDGSGRELLVEHAVSEGPGFGSRLSLNGGMDLEPENPSYGRPGLSAQSWRVSGKSDLEALGLEGEIRGYADRKEAGFSSPDQEFQYDQDAWEISGRLALDERTDVTFGTEGLSRGDGRRDQIGRLGLARKLAETWLAEVELAQDRREGDTDRVEHGTRTDAALRLTWAPDESRAWWIFAQSTLGRDAGRLRNDRIGAGAKLKLAENTDILVEASDGSLGAAARAEIGWQRGEASRTTIGYRLDPTRRLEDRSFTGRDRGSLIFSGSTKLNDRWSYTTENIYSAFGATPSLATHYGISYTPSAAWRIDTLLRYGESREAEGTSLSRRGLSLAASFKEGDLQSSGAKFEWTRENSDRPDNALDRKTWLVSAWHEYKVSQDWRFVSALDAVLSQSDQSSWRDGRYVEARVGYAWRPAANDHINALFSYSWLYDMPGADQVNIDGELNGDRQKTHLLNAAINWQVNPVWTLGAKYGFRQRQSAPRQGGSFTDSTAHLLVLRADLHVVHNWDLMIEGRQLLSSGTGFSQTAGLIGLHRHVGNNLRIGAGYLHGRVSDDLRTIKAPKSGFFINLTSQF